MDRYALAVFLSEARRQATHTELAAADLARAAKDGDDDRLWYSIHALLIALGNLSKLMWPSRNGDRERGLILRALLNVAEDSPLKSRHFRGHWEHYDERLDRWARKARRQPPDDFIGPLSRFPNRNLFIRAYDPKKQSLRFRGQFFELAPILSSVGRLRQLAYEYGYEAASGALQLDKVERAVKGKRGEIEARRAGTWPA
jgi:hypothetical protein